MVAKGPNFVAKTYTWYFINGYRFHTKARDAPCKTQNSGVTLSAITDSFASARDQSLVDGMIRYYGIIQYIIEIDYWGCLVLYFLIVIGFLMKSMNIDWLGYISTKNILQMIFLY